MIGILANGGIIYFSDVPNIEFRNVYAGSGFKKLKYLLKYKLGKDQTGKFWSKHELDKICKNLNLKGEFKLQPDDLPYSNYRFDYLIKI